MKKLRRASRQLRVVEHTSAENDNHKRDVSLGWEPQEKSWLSKGDMQSLHAASLFAKLAGWIV